MESLRSLTPNRWPPRLKKRLSLALFQLPYSTSPKRNLPPYTRWTMKSPKRKNRSKRMLLTKTKAPPTSKPPLRALLSLSRNVQLSLHKPKRSWTSKERSRPSKPPLDRTRPRIPSTKFRLLTLRTAPARAISIEPESWSSQPTKTC